MSTKPTVVLLAGGENSRFFPLNTGTHKGCRVVAGKPLLVWALEDLVRHGFSKVVLVVSDKDFNNQGISAELPQHNLPLDMEYVLQAEPKGQADAILLGTKSVQEDCIIASPYYLNLGELAAQLAEAASNSSAECFFLGSQTNQPEHYGILSIEGNKVTGVSEKPTNPDSNKKINSVYFLRKSFLEFLAAQPLEQYSLESAFNNYAKDHLIEWQEVEELPSLKFAWHLLDFMNSLLKKQSSYVSTSATIAKTAVIDESNGPVYIDDNVKIGDFAKVSGPAYIGKNTLIGDYTFIRQSSIEKDAQIGVRTEIVRSLLESGVTIHDGYCADSIIGAHSKVAAGLVTANKRLDRAEVKIMVGDQKIGSTRDALGIITGEDVNLGIRVSTMPGVLIGARSIVYPSVTLFENIEPESVTKTSN